MFQYLPHARRLGSFLHVIKSRACLSHRRQPMGMVYVRAVPMDWAGAVDRMHSVARTFVFKMAGVDPQRAQEGFRLVRKGS